MRDVIWTIIGIWVFYKLYSIFFSRSSSTVYEKHDHHYTSDTKVHIHSNDAAPKTKSKAEDVEYTDFEEIK